MIEFEDSLSRIRQFQVCLNSPDIAPKRTYRRDNRNYGLVSYVNNITGLFLSSNYEVIPIFVARAAEHMAEFPASTPVSTRYYELVSSYLTQMAFHIVTFISGIQFDDSRIPLNILVGGPQLPPNNEFQRTPDGTAE